MKARDEIRKRTLSAAMAVLGVSVVLVATGSVAFWHSWTEEADRLLKVRGDKILTGTGEAPGLDDAFLSGRPAECILISLHPATGTVQPRRADWPSDATAGLREGGEFRTRRVEGRTWRVMALQRNGAGVKMALDLAEVVDELREFVAKGAWAAAGLCLAAAWIAGHSARRAFSADTARAEAQARFSVNAAHELRTPLAALQMRISLAQRRDDVSEGDLLMLAELSEEARRAREISDALLLFARADAGKLLDAKEWFDLVPMLRDLATEAEAEYSLQGIRVSTEFHERLSVRGDARLMKLALSNLIRNAGLYNFPHGFIRMEGMPSGGEVHVDIINSGPVVPAEEHDRLFTRFSRGSGGSVSGRGGTGLGLSLSRAIVEAHHGSVILVSSDAEGTRFRVSLPEATFDSDKKFI